jgi:LytS/YehU family sensor histidine kinase
MAVVWTLLALASFFQLRIQTNEPNSIILKYVVSVMGCSIVVTHILSDVLLPWCIKRKRLFLFFGLFLLGCMILAIPFALIDIDFAGGMLPGKSFFIKWTSMLISALLITGNICGLRFYREHAVMAEKHQQLQTAHLEAELKLLRDQVNPHFLFNVLNSIHVLMQKDVKQASSVLLKFSDMLRHHLYDSTKEYIPLKAEIGYLQNYVNVEKIRWGNDVRVECHWIDVPEYYHIVPFILSPFVENAFKHASHEQPESNYIKIETILTGNRLLMLVENSFDKENAAPRFRDAGGIGLENVQKRLSLMYPNRHRLDITNNNHVFLVRLSIQLSEV